MNSGLKKILGVLIKRDLNWFDYWKQAWTITTIHKRLKLYMLIRFNIELRDSQYKSYYNQKLIVLKQFAKLDNFKSNPIRKYNKLSIKNIMHMQLKNWIVIETKWSK